MKTLWLSIFGAAMLLAGCAHTNTSGPTAADDPSLACFEERLGQTKYARLYTKIAPNPWAATLDQLASKERVSEDEKPVISAWAADRTACTQAGQDYRDAYAPPGYNAAFNGFQSALIGLTARLYSGELTYGQFNQERMRLADQQNKDMDQLMRAHLEAANRPNQIDPVRQQMMVDQMRRAFTPGPRISPSINCISQTHYGTTYTDCR